MNRPVRITWRLRLLLAFLVLVPMLLLMIVSATVRDYIQTPQNFHWGNGGEEQIVGAIAIYGGLGALCTYVLFIVPLVLLWPLRSQLNHWYAFLLVSLVWVPLALSVAGNARPTDMLHSFLHPFHRDLVWLLEPFAFLASGFYLFLLYRFDLKARRGD